MDDWPDVASAKDGTILEPVVDLQVAAPREHLSACLAVLEAARARQAGLEETHAGDVRLAYPRPERESKPDGGAAAEFLR